LNDQNRISRMDFLKMIGGAAAAMALARLSFRREAVGTSAERKPQTSSVEKHAAIDPSNSTVLVYSDGVNLKAVDVHGNTISTGSLDRDSAKVLQAGINFINLRGGGILHIKTGVYKINANISIATLTNTIIEGDGRDATILRANVPGVHLLTKDNQLRTENVIIRDMTLDGNNTGSFLINLNGNSYYYLLDNLVFMRGNAPIQCFLVNCYNLAVRKCVFKDPASAGDLAAIQGSRIIVEDCFFTRTTVPGGGLTSGGLQESRIVNCTWEDFNGYGAISLENFSLFDNILITGNSFKNCSKTGSVILTVVTSTTAPAGSLGHTHNRILIIGNHLSGTGSIQFGQQTGNVIIQGNTFEDTTGISVTEPTNCIISDNIIRNTKQNFPIIVNETGGSNLSIHDNLVENSIQSAITVRACRVFNIKDNLIINSCTQLNNNYNGIHLQSVNSVSCDYGKIYGNTVISTNKYFKPKYSIYVEGNYIEVKENKVSGYVTGGIGQGDGTAIVTEKNQII
jgi:hypothetical protein